MAGPWTSPAGHRWLRGQGKLRKHLVPGTSQAGQKSRRQHSKQLWCDPFHLSMGQVGIWHSEPSAAAILLSPHHGWKDKSEMGSGMQPGSQGAHNWYWWPGRMRVLGEMALTGCVERTSDRASTASTATGSPPVLGCHRPCR